MSRHDHIDPNAIGPAPLDAALVQAYRETEYRVSAEPPIVLRVDQANAALAALHVARGVTRSAFVTAFNPSSERLDDATNAARHRALCDALTREGIAWLPAEGAHPDNGWPAETGVLVLDVDLPRARAIGQRWAQHAIVHSASDAVPRLVLVGADPAAVHADDAASRTIPGATQARGTSR